MYKRSQLGVGNDVRYFVDWGSGMRKLIGLVGLLAIVLSACASQSALPLASASTLPAFLNDAAPRVREAYQYAVANPHELENYPCFCGCGKMGHKSNLNCYVKSVATDGTITFDNHASGCGICVDITQDVMRLKSEGQTPLQIRRYVDSHYSSYGPSTDTPLPAA